MTVQYVINQLIIHFCEKDTFTLDDAVGIEVEPELESRQFDLVLAALEELEGTGMIRSIGGNEDDEEDEPIWILTRPMQGVGQDVGISIQTSILIRDTIEQYMKANNLPYENIDPFHIHEGHIRRVLEIVSDVLDKDGPSPQTP